MKNKAFTKMLALLLAGLMFISNIAMIAVSAEAECPGAGKQHTLANCPGATVVNTVAPTTCGTLGYTVYKCPTCNASFVDNFVQSAAAHTYTVTSPAVTKKAPCGTSYVAIETCSVCGDVKGLDNGNRIVAEGGDPVGEHTLDAGTIVETATGCKLVKTCTECGEKVNASEHKWNTVPTIKKAPTFTDDGIAVYTCTDCKATKEVVILCEHTHDLDNLAEKASTCTEDGYKAHTECSICHRMWIGDKEVTAADVRIPAGHEFFKKSQKIETVVEGKKITIATTGEPLILYVIKNTGSNPVTVNVSYTDVNADLLKAPKFIYAPFVLAAGEEKVVAADAATLATVLDITVAADDPATKDKDESAWSLEAYNVTNTIAYTTASTCTTLGICKITCSKCTGTTSDFKPAVLNYTLPLIEHSNVVQSDNPATCTAWGYKIATCSVCGLADIKSTAPLGHTTLAEAETAKTVSVTEPTCATAGHKDWACTRCGEPQTVAIPALGCDYKKVTVSATCSQYGYSFEYCTREDCDNNKNNKTATMEYKEKVNGAEKVLATCDVTVGGKTVFVKLGSLVVDIAGGFNADNHDKSNCTLGTVNAATCTSAGNAVYYCKNCNVYFIEVIPALGHNYSYTGTKGDVNVSYQTCTTGEVWKVFNCKNEGCTLEPLAADKAVIVVLKAATGHTYDATKGTVVEATCSHGRYTEYTCTNSSCPNKDKKVQIADPTAPKLEYKNQYTLTEAQTAHKSLSFVEHFRAGSCTVIGLDLYNCSDCKKNVLVVVDNTGKGHVPAAAYTTKVADVTEIMIGNRDYSFEAKAATCEGIGWTTQFVCVCSEFIAAKKIDALGHTYDGKTPVCTGAIECDRCDKALAAAPHIYASPAIDSRVADCVLFGYEHAYCTACKTEYITKYADPNGHTEIAIPAKNPTCTVDGCKDDGKKCSVCGVITKASTVIPATGHKNAAGQIFYDRCNDTVTDRTCVVCGEKNVGTNHDYVLTSSVASTCTTYGYKLSICKYCNEEKVENLATLAAHTLGDVIADKSYAATYHTTGLEVRKCSVCGYLDNKVLPILTGVGFIAEIDNAVVPGAKIVDSSLIKVTVSIDANNVDVWGYKFDLAFSTHELEFVKAEFTSNEFITLNMAHDNYDMFYSYQDQNTGKWRYGIVSVVGNTANTEDGKPQDYTVEGKHALVDLYFRVKLCDSCYSYDDNDAFPATLDVYFEEGTEAVSKDEKADPIVCTGYGDEVEAGRFLDINLDGDFNLPDALAVYNIVCGVNDKGYDPAADVDNDGEITIADFTYIYEYLVGAKSFEDLTDLGRTPEEIAADEEEEELD